MINITIHFTIFIILNGYILVILTTFMCLLWIGDLKTSPDNSTTCTLQIILHMIQIIEKNNTAIKYHLHVSSSSEPSLITLSVCHIPLMFLLWDIWVWLYSSCPVTAVCSIVSELAAQKDTSVKVRPPREIFTGRMHQQSLPTHTERAKSLDQADLSRCND